MKDYPEYRGELKRLIGRLHKAAPGPMAGFAQLHKEAVSDGVLSARVKELIALGIAIGVGCDACIAYHVHDALRAGATREEVAETIGVAVLMGGGPAMMYGSEALDAVDQFAARFADRAAARPAA